MSVLSYIAGMLVKKDKKKERILKHTYNLREYIQMEPYVDALTLLQDKIFVKSTDLPSLLNDEYYVNVNIQVFDYLVDKNLIVIKSKMEHFVLATVNKKEVKKVLNNIKKEFFRSWKIVALGSDKKSGDVFRIDIGPYFFYVVVTSGGLAEIAIDKQMLAVRSSFELRGFANFFLREHKDKFYKAFREVLNKQIQKMITVKMLQGNYNNTRHFIDENITYTGS